MKRFLALAALVLGMVSCQTEPEGLDVNVGGEQDVNITVSLPEGTRADSALGAFENVDFTKYDVRFQCEVHYGNEKKVLEPQFSDNGKEASFNVRLIANRNYTFVVWADLVNEDSTADLHYNTSNGLANISINDWAPMDETRDAFTCSEVREFTRNANIRLELKRPFAKLRVITTDIEELMGIVPTKAEVEYTTEYRNSFNAVEAKAGDVYSTKTHNRFEIASYGETGTDKTLFADYLFVGENDIVNFAMTVYDQDGVKIDEQKNFNTPIPVKRNYVTTIKGNILTYADDFTVTIEDAFDGENAFVDSRNAAQSSLDYAIDNTTIYLEKDVDYGTLYIRPVAGASNTTTDCDYLVYRNEMHRSVKNLTIVGAEGATVDAIKVVAGYVQDSGSTGYVVDIENLVIDGVKFTDKHTNAPHSYAAPIFIDLTYTNVDGLTVKNCKLEGNNDKMNFVYVYGSGNPSNSTFETAAKNIVIENNTVDGIARLCELRQTENVTITNNTIKNTALHAILLPVDNGTYSGNVTITDNYAEGINERFVRMAGAGNATVVIKDNTIVNYQGDDDDFIKVTDGTNVTIENNILISYISTAAQFISALNANGYYEVINDITISDPQAGTLATRANDNKESVIDLNGYTITFENVTAPVATIEAGNSVTFVGEGSLVVTNSTAPAILNEGTVVDETFNVTDEIISSNGDGVVEFEVSDVEDLISFVNAVDGGNTFEGKIVKLTEDVDLYAEDENGEPICVDPIGSYRFEKAFMGTFDGQGHTISGLNQNTWALNNGYYYNDCGLGLFGALVNAKIQNLTIDDAHISGESGLCGIISAYAENTTFENITVKNSDCADYQYYSGGIVGWVSGKNNFINCNLDASTIVGGQWGDFSNSNGGIIGGASGSATILMKDCNVACRIDAVNDVVSTYHYYAYRCCGMLIGNTNKKQDIDGTPYAAAPQLTCENVTVTYGDWMNYHYCEFGDGKYAYVRAEAGVSVSGYVNIRYGHPTDANGNTVVDHNHAHNDGEDHHICLPFDQLLGGGPNGDGRNPVYGLASFPGVTVVYPAEYTCPICGEQHNVAE